MHWTIDIGKVLGEYISRQLIFTVIARDVKLLNSVMGDGGLVSIDDGIVSVDPHRS